MEARIIKKEERLESNKISSVAFQYSYDCKVDENDTYPNDNECEYGSFDDDGKMMGRMSVIQHEVYFDGHIVKSGGIGGVATLPEYRHKKAIRRIFEVVFEDMKAKNQYVSQLYPFSFAYYNKFNYETTYERLNLKFPFTLLNERADIERNNRCKLIEDNKNADLRAVYERYAARHNGAYKRNDNLWKSKLSENIYNRKQYPYVYYNEKNEPAGYFVFTRDNDNFKILELCYETPEDIKGILGFIKNFVADYKYIRLDNFPASEDFTLMFTNQYDVERSFSFATMTSIVDVKKVLELMKYPMGNGNFSISVDDKFQTFNKGIYNIGYKDGKIADIEQKSFGSSNADIDVSSTALAKLVFGTRNLPEYKFMDGIKINDNIDTLNKVFIKKHIYLGDYF